MKRMMTMLVAAICAVMLHGGDAERLEELERICAAEPNDDLFRPQVIPTPDDIIAKYHITTNQLIDDLKAIAMKYGLDEQDEHKREARSFAVAQLGRFCSTNDLPFLAIIMTNNCDYAQSDAIGAGIRILQNTPELVGFALGIVTNTVCYNVRLRDWTCAVLSVKCQGKSNVNIENPVQRARIAAFFVEQAGINGDLIITMDKYACELNPWYRHSQQRRDNLARLRPPGLAGRPAEIYDAAQADAAQGD